MAPVEPLVVELPMGRRGARHVLENDGCLRVRRADGSILDVEAVIQESDGGITVIVGPAELADGAARQDCTDTVEWWFG